MVFHFFLSVAQNVFQDQVDSISEVPLLAESDRLPKLHAAIFTDPKFEDASILGFLQFVWSVSLRSLSQLPGMTTQAAQLTEFDDQCLEKALNNKAFDFATKLVQTRVSRSFAYNCVLNASFNRSLT